MRLRGSLHLPKVALVAAGILVGNISCRGQSLVELTQVSEPAGIINQTSLVETGTEVNSVAAPLSSAGYSLIQWTLAGVRQEDALGRSLQSFSFTILEPTTITAHYLPTTQDSDVDKIEDWYEWWFFGDLARDGSDDSDGDGFDLSTEKSRGYDPLLVDSIDEGGVSRRLSASADLNLAGFSTYRWVSSPSGIIDEIHTAPDGTEVSSPDLWGANTAGYQFAYWQIGGVIQSGPDGKALGSLQVALAGDLTATAVYLPETEDSDIDTLPDWYEWNYFSDLTQSDISDPDSDGWLVGVEFSRGYDPLLVDSIDEGGVSRRLSADETTINLQPFERLSKVPIGGVLTDFFSPDPNVVTGIQAGTWSATAMTDWDGDGDLDLFVAHEDGLRVFHNIGSPNNPNFEEITSGFAGLANYIASIDRPILTGGDWNGDGLGDLVIGGNTGTLRLVASDGSFTSNGSGLDFTVASSRTSPALGDMNGDGRADLLVLLDDGTASLFLNDGTSTPFSGGGSANFLGTAAPDGTSIAIGDINQDGLPDVLLADSDGRIWEFLNNGSGGFSLQSKVWGGSYPGFASGLTLAAADLEGDGDLDLIGGLANGGVIALRDPSVGRPTGLIAAPGADSIQLEWDANWQSRIRGYHIYRGTAEEGPFGKLLPDYVPLPSYLDSSIDPTVPSYYYYVTGVSYFFLPGNSTPRIVESLPSDLAITAAGKVVLSVLPARANPGQRLKLSLSIANATGVSGEGMQLRIAYDTAKLLPSAQTSPGGDTVLSSGLSRNLVFTDNGATANGELVIDGTGGQCEPGSGTLFTLQFEVDGSVARGTPLGAAISGGTMYDLNGNPLILEILTTDPPESGETYFPGDVDGDGVLTNADMDLLKELTKPKSRPATAEELMAGDLNGDGKLDAKDLVLMKQLLSAL